MDGKRNNHVLYIYIYVYDIYVCIYIRISRREKGKCDEGECANVRNHSKDLDNWLCYSENFIQSALTIYLFRQSQKLSGFIY